MNEKDSSQSRLSFLPFILALTAGTTWYVQIELFKRIDRWPFWTQVWGPGTAQLDPRKWTSWMLSAMIFLVLFEMFRRFDWFFQPDPAIGVTGPNGRDSTIGASESKEGKARQEERERQREERKLRQEERQKARDAKRTEDKARREKEKEDALREKAEKAANERARKVREAAEEVILEEDRLIELKHGKSLGLKGKLTPDEIKKKYRELMTQYHPDKVRGMGDEIREVAERKAKEINEAYDYFRKKYDL